MTNRTRLRRTPSTLAGLGPQIDSACPRMCPLTAFGLITAIYLLFFAASTLYAAHILNTELVLPSTDYTTFNAIYDIVDRAARIFGAVAILVLVIRALGIPRPLAGVPRYPASPVPSLLTLLIAVGGIGAATIVRVLLEDPAGGVNDDGGGIVGNPAALLSLVSALSAGVVEEVVIVAVPVLLGRRAGWNPLFIVGGCALLRVPFHLYQGWVAIPWALIWGAAYAAAALALRTIPDRRRRLNPDAPTATRAAARITWQQTPTSTRTTYAVLAALVVALAATTQILTAPDDAARIGMIALWGTATAVAVTLMWRAWTAANMLLIPRDDGRTGVLRWHTTYTGYSRLDTITSVDDVDAIRRVAQLDHHTIALAAGNPERRRRFHTLGYLPSDRFTLRTIRIPHDQATGLPATQEPTG